MTNEKECMLCGNTNPKELDVVPVLFEDRETRYVCKEIENCA